ncbi:MAG TPA: substrate-binding domain-containing protein, partial [Candidatus Acidoferrum sp.]|nr:substrate-binding domain-containing protein [Candidatus Acidoferrum sp.]
MTKRISIESLALMAAAATLALACSGKKQSEGEKQKEAAVEAPAAPAAETTAAPASAGQAEPAASGAQKVIGMSQCNLGEPWRVQMNADVAKAAEQHPNLKMIFKDAQNDSLVQRSHIEEFIAQKVDVILVSPKEAAPLTEPVAKAFRAGIPVIVLDRAVLKDEYTT